jgi:precorrin-6A/cobalt-precorrin-6A reductase
MDKRLLILGGTTEAAELAERAVGNFGDRLRITTSLAGRLSPTRDLPGHTRVGGFGGVLGLIDYVKGEAIDMVVDATHPFAKNISDHVAAACAIAGVPQIILVRPPWRARPGDQWLEVDSFEQAAELLPKVARRAFLTTGPGAIEAFSKVTGVWFLVRLFQGAAQSLPLANHRVVIERPPFGVESERKLFEQHRIDTLITKQSGGPTDAKLEAARQIGAQVVMIQRPPAPAVDRVETVEEALAWIARRL